MIEQEHILDIYGSISDKTAEMLEAVLSSDWDRLAALEQDCHALIERLKRHSGFEQVRHLLPQLKRSWETLAAAPAGAAATQPATAPPGRITTGHPPPINRVAAA